MNNVSQSISMIEFAKNSVGYFNSGGNCKRIAVDRSVMKGQTIHLSWHIGRSTGKGEALFEGDGSALLAVEKLADVTFGGKRLTIFDPVKAENEKDGVYKIKLCNLPLHFDDEMLTKSLIKLNLENFIAANIFFDSTGYEDNSLVAVQLKSLLAQHNLQEVKTFPAKNGVCAANARLKNMNDCLNIIREKNNKSIDFGVSGGKLKIKLDLRAVIELEPTIYDILRPEMQKAWNIIKWSPAQFYGIKVFLIPVHKNTSDKSRIVIIGSDPNAIMLARNLYDQITRPLMFKFDNKSKCRLIYKYLKTKRFLNFKCCAIQIFIHSNTIKIYGTKKVKDIFKTAVQKFEENMVCHDITNVPRLLIRKCLLEKQEMKKITQYGQFAVYVNINVIKKLVQIIYCKQLPPIAINNINEMKSDDNNQQDWVWINNNQQDNIINNSWTDKHFITSADKGKQCIAYITKLLSDGKEKIKVQSKEVSDANTCGVCFMEIESNESRYKLKGCAHLFHNDCIEMQLNCACEANGTRPIRCASCNNTVSLIDIKRILNDDDKYEQLLIYSIHDHVKINPNKYRCCPTPDCKQIYLARNDGVSDNDDEKKRDGNTDANDNIFHCTECLRQYCLHCDIDYHFGMSCEEYFVSTNSDQDELLKLFLSSYDKDKSTKKCPNCNISADKLPHTCNHATCVYCNAHFCWKCLWMDSNNNKNGTLVYKHMNNDHNSYYG